MSKTPGRGTSLSNLHNTIVNVAANNYYGYSSPWGYTVKFPVNIMWEKVHFYICIIFLKEEVQSAFAMHKILDCSSVLQN